jgi:hypothetical protein
VLLNLGHWLRNYDLFGSPLGLSAGGGAEMGEEDISAYGNEAFGPAYLVSNIVRNLAIHAGTSSPQITQALTNGVTTLHRWLGVDLSDPRTTWKGKEFAIPRLAFDEDHTGNPVHVLLISWASAAILLNGRARRHDRRLVAYTLACLAAFVLFCGVFKWQPWHSRLQLPWFVLSAPVVGLVLAQVRSRRRRLVDTSALLLIATALLWAYYGIHDYRQAREYPRGGSISPASLNGESPMCTRRIPWLIQAARILGSMRPAMPGNTHCGLFCTRLGDFQSGSNM